MLIQHNPNEGLKHEQIVLPAGSRVGAHSAQPERGIETMILGGCEPLNICAHSAQPERGIETVKKDFSEPVDLSAHSAQPERGIETRKQGDEAHP